MPSTGSPSRSSTPQRRAGAPTHGSIQTSLVGASSTRSARPPARVRSNSSWSRISPPVRALISRARAATSVRVSPSARNFRNAGERWSASTKSHQLWSSHCPSAPLVAAREQRQQPLDEATRCRAAGRRAASPPRTRSGQHARSRRATPAGARARSARCAPPAWASRIRSAPTRWSRAVAGPTGSAASCPAGGGRSPGRSGSRARRAGRRARRRRARHRQAARLAAGAVARSRRP